jgi:glycosyltransferase involved in cell wall biosynthesis
MNPLVSVIIPFYNGVEWLSEAVQSVLDQTYNNFEIIVVNDGSREDVTDFLKKYEDKVIYRYKENGGAATARNLAMEIARGDYISFLDSDDLWLPEKTEKQIAFMENNGALWSHTGFYYWNPDTNKVRQVDNSSDFGNIYQKYYISVKIATPSVIIKKQLLNELSDPIFPVEYIKGQDSKFYHMISSIYPIYLVKEPLVKVRLRGNNTNTRALVRFSFKSRQYLLLKENEYDYQKVSPTIRFVFMIYHFYRKLFGYYEISGPPVKELFAKFFWIIPFFIERFYLRFVIVRAIMKTDVNKYTT